MTTLDNIDGTAELLLAKFYTNFAEECAAIIIKNHGISYIYDISTMKVVTGHPKPTRDKIIFRAAYVLEKIYFKDRELFEPYRERFLSDFEATMSESAKRHFGKIMLDLLRYTTPSREQCESIAETCVRWVTEPKAKPVVQIWAIEVLIKLSKRVKWLKEIMPEIMEPFTFSTSPAIMSRMKKWNIRKIDR